MKLSFLNKIMTQSFAIDLFNFALSVEFLTEAMSNKKSDLGTIT